MGRRLTVALNELGIDTVRDLRDAEPGRIRQHFSVVLERTVYELRGVSCLELDDVAPAKQQIRSSRSFGQTVFTLDELGEAITLHTTRAAEKLRRQGSEAAAIQVFVETSRFKPNELQYSRGITVPLAEATDDTLRLTQAALAGLKRIYKPGFCYAKAGVNLVEIAPRGNAPVDLFVNVADNARSAPLMNVLDAINRRFGRNTLGVGIAGLGSARAWSMKRGNKTPSYTTCWDELPVARA